LKMFNSGEVVIYNNLRVHGDIRDVGDNIWTPFHCAGKVLGTTLGILKSSGKYGYTVTRHQSHPAGVFKITFSTPHIDSNYIVNITPQRWATFGVVWDSVPPTTTDFHVVIYNTSNALENTVFHFTVV
jgi:hypothetical protein